MDRCCAVGCVLAAPHDQAQKKRPAAWPVQPGRPPVLTLHNVALITRLRLALFSFGLAGAGLPASHAPPCLPCSATTHMMIRGASFGAAAGLLSQQDAGAAAGEALFWSSPSGEPHSQPWRSSSSSSLKGCASPQSLSLLTLEMCENRQPLALTFMPIIRQNNCLACVCRVSAVDLSGCVGAKPSPWSDAVLEACRPRTPSPQDASPGSACPTNHRPRRQRSRGTRQHPPCSLHSRLTVTPP